LQPNVPVPADPAEIVRGRFFLTGLTGENINIMGLATGLKKGKHGFGVL